MIQAGRLDALKKLPRMPRLIEQAVVANSRRHIQPRALKLEQHSRSRYAIETAYA
jgi:hypothetical protein